MSFPHVVHPARAARKQLKPAYVPVEPFEALVDLLRLLAVQLSQCCENDLAHAVIDDLETLAPLG